MALIVDRCCLAGTACDEWRFKASVRHMPPAEIAIQNIHPLHTCPPQKWGRTYDVRLNKQGSKMYLQVMWRFLEQQSFPLTEVSSGWAVGSDYADDQERPKVLNVASLNPSNSFTLPYGYLFLTDCDDPSRPCSWSTCSSWTRWQNT